MTRAILLTGACGYLGSELIRELAAIYPDKTIRILDNLQNQGYAALMNLPEASIEFIEGDILDTQTVEYALQDVDSVVHMAAIVTTPMNFEHPTWVHQINHWA
ncbi:MAG TPA: NAD-dependent epimerase/dehydratase family protein, partial [Trueperaceae bacterium]|nr:NAD-dependent epimerase/dehydratase family protein [Trueperaceae bacterium]